MSVPVIFALVLLGWNLIVFLLYALDKWKAKSGRWRISEAALLACTFLLGGLGGTLGMAVARHKTWHLKFRLLVPLALVLQVRLLVWLLIRFYGVAGWG